MARKPRFYYDVDVSLNVTLDYYNIKASSAGEAKKKALAKARKSQRKFWDVDVQDKRKIDIKGSY